MNPSEIPDDRPADASDDAPAPGGSAAGTPDDDEPDGEELTDNEPDDDELDDDESDGGEDDDEDVGRAPARFRSGALIAALAVGVVLGLLAGVLPGRLHRSAQSSAAPSASPTRTAPPTAAPSPGTCTWYDRADSTIKVGRPATTGVPHSGPATLTIVTDTGTIVVAMDAGRTPCAIAAVAHLASHGYYAQDTCDRAATGLQCGTRRPDFAWTHEDSGRYPRVLVSQSFQVALPCDGLPKEVCDKSKGAVTTITSVTEQAVVPRGAVVLTAAPAGANSSGVAFGAYAFAGGGATDGIDGGGFMICPREARVPAEATPIGMVTSGLEIVDAWAGGRYGRIVSVSVTYG